MCRMKCWSFACVISIASVIALLATPSFAQSAQTAPSPVMVARPAVQQPATQPPHSYLKIDGITGESTDTAHPGWIEIRSFQWGMTAAAGSPADRAMRDLLGRDRKAAYRSHSTRFCGVWGG